MVISLRVDIWSGIGPHQGGVGSEFRSCLLRQTSLPVQLSKHEMQTRDLRSKFDRLLDLLLGGRELVQRKVRFPKLFMRLGHVRTYLDRPPEIGQSLCRPVLFEQHTAE